MEHLGVAQKIREACSTIRARILRRTNRRQQRQRQTSTQPATTLGVERKIQVEEWIRQPLNQ